MTIDCAILPRDAREEPVVPTTWGWWPIWVYVTAHNIAVSGRREYLSNAAQRHRRAHPVLVPLAWFLLVAHLMGWLGRLDPVSWSWSQLERVRR